MDYDMEDVRYEVRYSNQSSNDLDAIFEFLENSSGVDVAKRIVSEIMDKADSLSFMPGGYNFDERIKRKLNNKYPTQAVMCGKYIILFVVEEENQIVQITHVLSSRSDYLRLLK